MAKFISINGRFINLDHVVCVSFSDTGSGLVATITGCMPHIDGVTARGLEAEELGAYLDSQTPTAEARTREALADAGLLPPRGEVAPETFVRGMAAARATFATDGPLPFEDLEDVL